MRISRKGGNLSRVIISMILFCCLCSCGAKKAYVTKQRYFPTGISSEEGVVILLNESRRNSVDVSEHKTEEDFVENCMTNAMKTMRPELTIVSDKDFRRTVFPGKNLEETPRSAETLLAWLQDNSSRCQVEKLGISYMIVVNTSTSHVNKHWEFEVAEPPGWGIGQYWTRISDFSANVIDVRQPAKSGAISSVSDGRVGYVVPVFLIIPLPPIPILARTESEACSALGVAVVKFLEGRENQ